LYGVKPLDWRSRVSKKLKTGDENKAAAADKYIEYTAPSVRKRMIAIEKVLLLFYFIIRQQKTRKLLYSNFNLLII